ncbi:MAG: N-acetyltransferase family protein [Defluviitaleaceae bacterium]|nr:N-acetyltransferase family protein [Defluviitaleaceae bacterium]
MIRKVVKADLTDIVSIYNQAVNSRRCTGDTVCFEVEERIPWLEAHDNKKTPAFVYESESKIVAYSCISPYRPGRQAFEGVGEISYYVDFNYHGKGIGSQLIEHLITEGRQIGYTHLIAMLLDCNTASINMLEKYDFSVWGVMPSVARIDDKRYSHLYYGVEL